MRRDALVLLVFVLAACSSRVSGMDAGDGSDASVSSDAGASDAGTACSGRAPANHRVAGNMCDRERPPPPDAGPLPDAGDCRADSDCTQGPNGRCVFTDMQDPFCSYDECFSDGDCDGGACACRNGFTEGANACLPGNCRVDSDCGPCGYCSPAMGGCGPTTGITGFYCHTPKDECLDDSDCASMPGTSCSFSPPGGRWICTTIDCAG